MSSRYTILVINPGSTSTKLAVYQNGHRVCDENVRHETSELTGFSSVADQRTWRGRTVDGFLKKNERIAGTPDAVIGRGGLLAPVTGGVYAVNKVMIDELAAAVHGEHASNLGALLAADVAQRHGCNAYIADPVVVDEMIPAAKMTGIGSIERRSIFHALNQKAAARLAAAELGKPYTACRLICAHLGGGISVGAHLDGMVVDVNNALDGDGPFAVERAGTVPAGALTDLCVSGEYYAEEIRRMLSGGGGLVSLWGSNDFKTFMAAVEARDTKACAIYQAMVLKIAQEISRHGATLQGHVDGIVLTGGMARNETFTAAVAQRIGYLGRLFIYPGEHEMEALAGRMLDVLEGREQTKEYPCSP